MISVALFYHGDSLMAYCGQRRNDAFAPSVTLSCVNVLGLTFHTGIATALSSFLFDCKMRVGMLIRKVSSSSNCSFPADVCVLVFRSRVPKKRSRLCWITWPTRRHPHIWSSRRVMHSLIFVKLYHTDEKLNN